MLNWILRILIFHSIPEESKFSYQRETKREPGSQNNPGVRKAGAGVKQETAEGREFKETMAFIDSR